MIKFFRKLHLWLSVPFGIIITITCLTGAILVLEPEITRAIRSDVYYVADASGSVKPVEELIATVEAEGPDSLTIANITVFDDPRRAYQVNFAKRHSAALFIDQYTGKITGRYERLGFFTTILHLHRRLLDDSASAGTRIVSGKQIVGISTLMLVVILITGLILWWPRAAHGFANSLSIPLRSGWHRFWMGLHVAGGVYSLILVLVMALTGLTWSFGWYRTAFYSLFGASDPRAAVSAAPATLRTESREAITPDFTRVSGPNHSVDTSAGEKKTEAGIKVMTEAQAEGSKTFSGWVYAVHTGRFWGWISRILWVAGALLGASLPLTGYYIWIHRLRRKRR